MSELEQAVEELNTALNAAKVAWLKMKRAMDAAGTVIQQIMVERTQTADEVARLRAEIKTLEMNFRHPD